jgi:hypothetical protein
MLESAVDNRLEQLGLEQEITEPGRVDADVALLDRPWQSTATM